jgi:hypothetical protein
MAFTPDKPENIEDLYALIDTEFDEVVVVIYESDESYLTRMTSLILMV